MGDSRGIVLFAHGSRDARWREPVEAVAARVLALEPGLRVRCAYLEAATPDLATAVGELATAGVSKIDVLPIFLGVGKHLREDLPRLVADLQQVHPALRLNLRAAVGESPEVIDVLARLALKN
ncbi:sirohydrochlorin chelatase [Variovorax sp. OV329]|uniref:sirohydrochlorin chelatase n=1 Tax=Variovorax sp. OV329 TaxID=1882825 RepID=UPI0008F2555A|nr:CbiX/SirB N-terminal domain-containing protein [Variovorax sp. OV329]SFM67332.1 sirohydrochlorin cobaltochelatase [Variovorax sp. OV329]